MKARRLVASPARVPARARSFVHIWFVMLPQKHSHEARALAR